MRTIIILLGLMSFTPWAPAAPMIKHKSEAELISLTPAARVDEWVNEQVNHEFDLDDEQSDLIRKYVLRDGMKALPRLTEIMDEYDPTHRKHEREGDRFDACVQMIGFLEFQAVRLRGSEEGRRAMKSLELAVQRMRAAGFAIKDGHAWDWVPDGRFEEADVYLQQAKGIALVDRAIKETFRLQYKLVLSDAELLEFSNFLVAHYPDYPSWSEKDFIKDHTQLNQWGNPLQFHVMKKPARYYEVYLEFNKTRRQ